MVTQMLPIQRTPLQNKKKNMAMAKSRRRSAQIVTKNSSVILRGFLKVKMACCSIIVTIASSVTIASMISTQCEISSRNRPPPISEHLDLTFWVVAYERFDCISFFLFTFFLQLSLSDGLWNHYCHLPEWSCLKEWQKKNMKLRTATLITSR